jgi:NAD(P)-dependent dehydrogenase (short-subunit alcohol dehydrogenase family)
MMCKGSHIICVGSEGATITLAMLGAYQATKTGLERFCKTLDQEVSPLGIRVTLLRAGKMFGPEMGSSMDPETARRFTEESLRLGIDNRTAALSRYESVAEMIPMLLALPEDLHVPELTLTGRHA